MLLTFLNAAALQVALGTVQTGIAGPPLFLEQLVDPLDDALQRFIHIHPNLLLEERERARGTTLNLLLQLLFSHFRFRTWKVPWLSVFPVL